MHITNQASHCKSIVSLFNTSSRCFEDKSLPNVTDCGLLVIIYRLILIDCYISRLFYPTAAILIVIGTILNLFSLYCFLKMNKRSSQNVYLSVLSLGDTINLHVNFTIPLLRRFDKFDDYFHNFSNLCRINGFLSEFFLIFPTWIVVLLTFERLLCVLWPLKCYSLYTHKRAKISIILLSLVVVCLCFYRFYDFKGIDQISVFRVMACDAGSNKEITIMRHFNLIVWAILPECLTLIMNLIIVYNIKLAKEKFEPFYSKARRTKYNQATKTVLLISILFLVFHTPTGIMIGLNIVYTTNEQTIGLLMILASRKLTVILYQISLCCKFFIYNQTFRNFKDILQTSLSRFNRQTNSAKLGRPILISSQVPNYRRKSFQFNQLKHNNFVYQAKETDALVRHHHNNSTRTSTSTSRGSRDHQQKMNVIMTTANECIEISLHQSPYLLRSYTTGRKQLLSDRLSWRSKPQKTL